MAFETREQILEKMLSRKKPQCPHCGMDMNIWETPPMNFADGLGWGTPFLYICFNDECSLYKQGWDHMKENYAHTASYRCMCYPDSKKFELIPVFSPMGATGQIIDDQVVLEQEMIKEAIKKGFSILADCYVSEDSVTVMNLLLDASQPMRVRAKAAEMIGDIGETEAIEPLRNLKTGNDLLDNDIEKALSKIHKKFFTRECPFCAEIIKKRAKVCKHCGKEVAGN